MEIQIKRWEHNCEDYKKGTLNFCSACEYYYPTTKLTFWKKIKRLLTNHIPPTN